MRYEGDITTCKRCSYVHYLQDELIIFCEKCGYDMRLLLTPDTEKTLTETLDYSYKKARIDDLQ